MNIGCVIPSYNHEKYVAKAIHSVRNQTLLPDRIVVIDDGSTDRPIDLIRSIKNEKVQVYQQANAGTHADRRKVHRGKYQQNARRASPREKLVQGKQRYG